MKNVAKFVSPDTTQTLTVSAISGRKGINLKVTMKDTGKNKPRATTGCRATYDSEKDAQQSFDKLVKETESRGWKKITTRVRNAFTTIPAPVSKTAAPAAPAAKQKTA